MSIHIGPYTFDRVRYDAEADVLYLSIGDPSRAVDYHETPDGHAVRFDRDGDLVGLTIVDAQRRARAAGGELTLQLPFRANRTTWRTRSRSPADPAPHALRNDGAGRDPADLHPRRTTRN